MEKLMNSGVSLRKCIAQGDSADRPAPPRRKRRPPEQTARQPAKPDATDDGDDGSFSIQIY